MSILVRGSNKLVLHEAERSLHDALCVIRCLVKRRAIIAGGGAPETELAVQLSRHAQTLSGMEAYCFQVGTVTLSSVHMLTSCGIWARGFGCSFCIMINFQCHK